MPDEYQWFETSEREENLAQERAGPDTRWMANVHETDVIDPNPPPCELSDEDTARLGKMQALEATGMFTPLDQRSLPLRVLVRNLCLDACLAGKEATLAEALAVVVDGKATWLSEEAAKTPD